MRVLLLILASFFIVGCSSKSAEYLIPVREQAAIKHVNYPIGIKEVVVPEYLNSNKILIQKGAALYKIDANFAAIPSKLLTQNTIVTMKKALATPKVFVYPWDFKYKRGLIVTITLDEFIYKDGFGVISGSYYIKRADGRVVAQKNFSYKEPCKEESQEIVQTLSHLFHRVVMDIVRNIAR